MQAIPGNDEPEEKRRHEPIFEEQLTALSKKKYHILKIVSKIEQWKSLTSFVAAYSGER
jgi:hypothetical protein